MNKAFLICLIAFPSILLAQKTKMIKNASGKEKYEVLASDMKTKHGKFLVYGGGSDIALKGFYKNNLKDSSWTSYDYRGNIAAELRFSKDSLVYFKSVSKDNNLSAKPIIEQGQIDSVLTRSPYYLYGDGYLLSFLSENIRYPAEAKDNGEMGTVFVSFIVDKSGNARDFTVKQPLGYGLDEEAIRVLKLLPQLWIPGAIKESNVDAEVLFPIRFVLR